jgi:glycosyltransferase involved in cell wall biosynthesis
MKDPIIPRIGIGIVTYNRRDILAATVEKVRRFTRHPAVDFVVADDGSTDGTLGWLRDNDIPAVTGVNMGIAWNKNRALYFLSEMLGCETVILLEDDTQPSKPGWEDAWIAAGRFWGHANFAAPWMKDLFISGQGTPADPVLCDKLTAQCAVFSRESLLFGGFYDSRFRGYGHEHVEHTRRLVRVGFGGTDRIVDGHEQMRFKLIRGDISVVDVPSYENHEQAEQNRLIAGPLMTDQSYRAPWRDDAELKQFRAEMRSALDGRPHGFSLRGGVQAKATGLGGRLGRLFGRRPRSTFIW